MKTMMICIGAVVLSLSGMTAMAQSVQPRTAAELNQALDQLEHDSDLGGYATGEQSLARQAVDDLTGTSGKDYEHLLYMARQRVDIALVAAALEASQASLHAYEKEHSNLQVELAKMDADAARKALEREREQTAETVGQAEQALTQGSASTRAAELARVEADKARKLAERRSQEAAKARQEAELSEKAMRLMRERMQQSSTDG